jgi:hypothetical protein
MRSGKRFGAAGRRKMSFQSCCFERGGRRGCFGKRFAEKGAASRGIESGWLLRGAAAGRAGGPNRGPGQATSAGLTGLGSRDAVPVAQTLTAAFGTPLNRRQEADREQTHG